MSTSDRFSISRTSRRTFIAGAVAASLAAARRAVGDDGSAPRGAPPPTDPKPPVDSSPRSAAVCPRCGGLRRIPIPNAKPFVWLKGTPLPRSAAIVGESPCPVCSPDEDETALAAEAHERIDRAVKKHEEWEAKTGWKLQCVVTRHATVSTQLTAAQARTVGQALENLTLHLKRTTDSLALTPTRPDTLGLVFLWEKESWTHFREVMEQLFTPEQLGEAWAPAREYNAYDHFAVPHMYETPQSVRGRPPSCGAVFLVARRQIGTAADRHLPFWLLEGFGTYGDHAVHKLNRWYTVYSITPIPVGDWLADARRLAAEAKLRPWSEMVERELRDWGWEDHVQALGMVAFLLESEPTKFLDLIGRLRAGDHHVAALEDAYRLKLDELDARATRWLLNRR